MPTVTVKVPLDEYACDSEKVFPLSASGPDVPSP
jgi:hypothetical protein